MDFSWTDHSDVVDINATPGDDVLVLLDLGRESRDGLTVGFLLHFQVPDEFLHACLSAPHHGILVHHFTHLEIISIRYWFIEGVVGAS